MEPTMSVLSPRLGAFAAALAVLAAPALAQMPPPPPAPAAPPDVFACLCLKQSLDAASADMTARQATLDQARADLNQLDGQLAAERAALNVNDERAVAKFRQELQQRDTVYHRSTGETLAAAQSATARYNVAVGDYNTQCAGRPLPPPPPGPLSCGMR
jgi:hypothetical protein